MKTLKPLSAARTAVANNTSRPATAILADSADARLVVFRLLPGQQVAAHRNASTVTILVLSGGGVLTGEDAGQTVELHCAAGDLVVYQPNEAHSMRATESELVLLATITPRPGERNPTA